MNEIINNFSSVHISEIFIFHLKSCFYYVRVYYLRKNKLFICDFRKIFYPLHIFCNSCNCLRRCIVRNLFNAILFSNVCTKGFVMISVI